MRPETRAPTPKSTNTIYQGLPEVPDKVNRQRISLELVITEEMLGTSFELVHALHGVHNETSHRKRLSNFQQVVAFFIIALLTALVVHVGAADHRSDDVGGDSVPDRLRSINPTLTPILVCMCTFVTMSEYTFCNLVYILLHGRVHHMLTTFAMMSVSLLCNVAVEFFIVQSVGSNRGLYWGKVCGVGMAIYLRDGISDLQKWQTSKRD